MYPITKRFWLLFTLSLITLIRSQMIHTTTPYPTPNPTINPITPYPTPNPTLDPITPYPTPNPTTNPLSNKRCCQCTSDRTSSLQPHPPAGCPSDQICATEICSILPSCCNSDIGNGWTQHCANIAMISCSSNPTTCCQCTTETLGTPGCDLDEICQTQICQLNNGNTCCTNEWSLQCANIAQAICNLNNNINTPITPTNVYRTTLEPSTNPIKTPINSPNPTSKPTIFNLPSDCNDRCDAFSVGVIDSEIYENNVSISYKIERLFSDGLCKKSIKYIVLGLCDTIQSQSCNEIDINGLINYFEPISNRRRIFNAYSASGDSDSDSISYSSIDIELDISNINIETEDAYRMVWGSNSDGEFTGIRINIGIEKEFEFKINLRNVFINNPKLIFSNNIRFSRGKREFNCNEIFLNGLPCLDGNKFISGAYNNKGYNMKTKKFDIDSKYISDGHEYSQAVVIGENKYNSSWGVLSELDPYIIYSLIGIFVVFVLVMCVIGMYICNKRGIISNIRANEKRVNTNKDNANDINEQEEEDDIDLFSISGNIVDDMEDHSLVRFNSN